MRDATRGLLGACLALAAGACSQTRAPVVDVPVRDRTASSAQAPTRNTSSTALPDRKVVVSTRPDADWRPENYVVKKGDTLYAIALDHGQDYREVAAWNQITDPNMIHVGQLLRVRAPEGWTERSETETALPAVTRPIATPPAIEVKPLEEPIAPVLKKAPKAFKAPYSDKVYAERGGILDKATMAPPALGAAATSAAPGAQAVPAASNAVGASNVATPPQPTAVSPASTPTTASASTQGTASKPAPFASALPAPTTAGQPSASPAKPGSVQAAAKPVTATKSIASSGWGWPARGKVLYEFSKGPNPKGITIAGDAGEPVLASAAGKVVYSGSGLRGYGKLV